MIPADTQACLAALASTIDDNKAAAVKAALAEAAADHADEITALNAMITNLGGTPPVAAAPPQN
jgi:hypothetical protein